MVLTRVVRANSFPRMRAPSRNMATLKMPTKMEMSMPVKWFMIKPIPVVPPVIRPEGRIKKTTPTA